MSQVHSPRKGRHQHRPEKAADNGESLGRMRVDPGDDEGDIHHVQGQKHIFESGDSDFEKTEKLQFPGNDVDHEANQVRQADQNPADFHGNVVATGESRPQNDQVEIRRVVPETGVADEPDSQKYRQE